MNKTAERVVVLPLSMLTNSAVVLIFLKPVSSILCRMIHMKAQAMAERFWIARVDAVDGREVVVSPDKVALQWDTEINSM